MAWMTLVPRFRVARRLLPELAEREAWPREQIEAWQLERINAVWAKAAATAPYYRDLRRRLDLPERFASLAEYEARMPILRKRDVREAGADLRCADSRAGRWHKTGGSTGSPASIYWAHEDYRATLRARYRFYQSRGVDVFDRVTFLWGGLHRLRTGWRGVLDRAELRLLDGLRNRQRLSAYDLSTRALRHCLREIERFRPKMLYGFSTALHLLAREVQRTGFDCPSLRLVVMSSEVVTHAMRQAVRRGFDCNVAVEYGATECPLLAGEDAAGDLRVREDIVRLETLPTGRGRYEIVATVLVNNAFGLLRYAIEDVTTTPIHRPDRGFAILPPVGGRCDDVLVAGDGSGIHAAAIDIVFEEEPAIRRYRVSQRADGSILARVELDAGLPLRQQERLEQHLADVIADRPVRLEVVDEIPLTGGGKHRAITTELSPVDAPPETPAGASEPARNLVDAK